MYYYLLVDGFEYRCQRYDSARIPNLVVKLHLCLQTPSFVFNLYMSTLRSGI
jgi:hypothetical protein